MAAEAEIERVISSLVGSECSSAHWGKGTGSVIKIGIGAMSRREKPVNNPWLSERDRNFKADINLMIWCAWRIRRQEDVLVAWRDAVLESESVYRRASEIVGKKIIHATFDRESKDLRMDFEGGFRLDVFCDVTNEEEGDENYILYTPVANYIVGLDGGIRKKIKNISQ